MNRPDETRKSKVTSRKGELPGIFEQSIEHVDWLEHIETMPTHEAGVMHRLEYLTAFALTVLQDRCDIQSWDEKVLIVDGKRQPVPSVNEIDDRLVQLSAEGKSWRYGSARSVHEELSFGSLANSLDKACGAVLTAIERQDMFAALSNLMNAERFYRHIYLFAMEPDYVRGKSQRFRPQDSGQAPTDWNRVLTFWAAQRRHHCSDRQCDLAVMKKYNIASINTIKSQRQKRKMTGS